MKNMEYIRFSEGYNKNILIPVKDSPYKYINNNKQPHFISMIKYNQEHYNEYRKTGSLKGLKGGKTNKIWADFDSKDLKESFKDSYTFCQRLIDLGFKEENLQISFSGNKGVGIIVENSAEFTNEQVEQFCNSLAGDLPTFDKKMYDHQRIFRLNFTQNEKTGLYKIPLNLEDLKEANIERIKEDAKDLDGLDQSAIINYYEVANVDLPDSLIKVPEKVTSNKPTVEGEMDWERKPNNWKNCKWSLQQGNFKSGERHQALMVIAATCRGLGYDKDTAYYICKSALKKQAAKNGQDEFSKEELYKNIIEDSVYTDGWEGGQYTCSKPGWLQNYCQELGEHTCKTDDNKEEDLAVVRTDDMLKVFSDYAENFEKNIVKTGIPGIDANVLFLASTHNGILGQPGGGKTSFVLEWLRNASNAGIESTFLSLDMGKPIIAAKLIQKYFGCPFKEALRIFREDKSKAGEVSEWIRQEYKHVGFNFRSGLTPADVKRIALQQEQESGNKVKLIVGDYLECFQGPFSDATANTGFISQQMKDVANDISACSVMLLQTQKHSTSDISDPLLSMKQVKGSSVIEQSASVIMTLWREGYNPKTVDDDRYISFAAVKNRFGSLWSDDFLWDGVRGNIRDLAEEEREELAEFKQRKAQMRAAEAERSKAEWT